MAALDIKIVMPLLTYHAFLGRCATASREYAILRNSVIEHIPGALPSDWIEFLCSAADAQRLLDHASRVYPAAAAYMERSLGGYSIRTHEPALRYRKRIHGDTWHFARSCSEWPVVDFVERVDTPLGHELCNECIVKTQQEKNDI